MILDYETSTFHHLSSWKLQYQRLVSQLNRSKGPEFQPDQSFDSSSLSDASGAPICATMSSNSSEGPFEGIKKLGKAHLADKSGLDASVTSMDSSSLPGDDVAAPFRVQGGPVYLHLDMDAFYANVLIHRRYPHLIEKPVVVVPAKNTNNGTSEVASANYVARGFGIRARMFVSEARKMCANLEVLTCDFTLFEDTSARMYEQILRYTHTVEAVSADEAYLDITPWGWTRALELSRRLQKDVSQATHCPCSIGVGPNKLIARLSTSLAKPAGIIITEPAQTTDFMKQWKITDLPSFGHGIASKLAERGIQSMEQLFMAQRITLQDWFGEKTGTRIFEFSRGIDTRPLKTEQDRKSVGTQISWGVRMVNQEQVNAFLMDLSAEVCKRLSDISMVGAKVSLRVLKKKTSGDVDDGQVVVDARMGGFTNEMASMVPKGESAKAFNPGQCTQISRSGKLAFATGDAKVVGKEILRLYKFFDLAPLDFRGAGISVDDLVPASNAPKVATIHSFFRPTTAEALSPMVPSSDSVECDSPPPRPKRTYSEIASVLVAPRVPDQKPPKPAQYHSPPASKKSPPSPPKPPSTAISGVKKQATITSMFSKATK